MARASITDVQHTQETMIREYLREINVRLRALGQVINLNDRDMWESLRFPASNISLSGLGSPPAADTTFGWLLFDATATETIGLLAQMPHAWKEDSVITPHVHWCKSTAAAGLVQWRLEYRAVAQGSALPGAWTTIETDGALAPATPDNDTQYEHLVSPFPDIDLDGFGISDMLVMRLSRIGGDATYDTYGADAAMMEFDIQYQRDARGSVNVYDKEGN